MYPGSAPHSGGKHIVLLDYIDVCLFTMLPTTQIMSMEATEAVEAMRDKWRISLCHLGQALYKKLGLGF
jgi:hypothetical protein